MTVKRHPESYTWRYLWGKNTSGAAINSICLRMRTRTGGGRFRDVVHGPILPHRHATAYSHWLEVKMETEDSPDPDLSPTQSSPDLSSDSTHHPILSPPSAFADSSPQRRHPAPPPHYGTPTLLHNLLQATPASQVHGTPAILQNRGATFTIRGQGTPSLLQDSCLKSVDNPKDSGVFSSTTNSTWVGSSTPVVGQDGVIGSAASSVPMTSVLQRGTPSIMATASMINSTFGLRSPSSGRRSGSVYRTPCLVATDSVMGNSTFGVRSPSSLTVSKHRTPSIMLTDSVMGNSTFAVQSLSSATLPASSSASRQTPVILVSNSVMGNSPMKTPTTPLQQTSQPATVPVTNTLPGTLPATSSPEKSAHLAPSTPQPPALTVPPAEEVEVEEEQEEMMEVTSFPEDTLEDLAECRARMDSIRNHEDDLKEELLGIKGQFFDLLDNLGLSHDIYYSAVTPADTPAPVSVDPKVSNKNIPAPTQLLTVTSTPPLPNINNNNNNNLSTSVGRMSTPRSTPRRVPYGRHRGLDAPAMYADLLIDQLLAQAHTDSDSSKSNSPPEAIDDSHLVSLPEQQGSHQQEPVSCRFQDDAYNLAQSVNLNRGPEDTPTKDSAKSKDIPAASSSETAGEGDQTLLKQSSSVNDEEGLREREQTVTPESLEPTNQSVSSVPASTSSGSSSGRSVPDLDKELVSRMQYYSDFTIDRQMKIDKAAEMPEVTEESSPPTASDHSSETLSQRCVEGSESNDQFKRPTLPSKLTVPAVPSRSHLGHARRKDGKVHSKHSPQSSDMCESDTSSGTGSMPRSHRSTRHSSQQSSKHSSRDRHSAYSSSSDRRSSSRSSRCSTHPLASSTLISDPSNSSPGSGSIYTWSLDNSSDENLHQSFLRSEKKHRRRSRTTRRRSSTSRSSHSHRSTASHCPCRPATLVGADSPPNTQRTDVSSSLHLTHMVSAIESPTRRFGGRSYENSTNKMPSPRSTSLPRTSTRLGNLMTTEEAARGHKAASFPELTSPSYPDLDCAVARIGPSNLSSSLQQTVAMDGYFRLQNRPDLPGKSSTSGSATSYNSQCSACNPRLSVSTATEKLMAEEDPYDEILTNSPRSYDSGGVHAPCNSYTSPAGSTNDYTTVSDSSPDRCSILASAPRLPRPLVAKNSGVFKVPLSPATRTVRRKATAGGRPTHNVGVRVVGTPHLPVGLLRHKEPVSRRKLFSTSGAPTQSSGSLFHAPKILDRKALVRKFKKFSTNFKKDKDSAKIHTLANL